ncbi:MAG TPA: c-type cytochrome [Vicinamibacterales bacterium]
MAARIAGRGWRVAALLSLLSCQVTDGSHSATPATYGLGTPASASDIAALDGDVSPSGEGLPPGRGDAIAGAALYAAQCASCHGAGGEGMTPNPALVGREPREGFPFGGDPKLVRTIGNYWPEATTLFDYIKRTMPLTAPGSLSDDEVYSLTAHLLVANEILPAGATLDSATLVAVRMPARDRFVPDDRRGGRDVR